MKIEGIEKFGLYFGVGFLFFAAFSLLSGDYKHSALWFAASALLIVGHLLGKSRAKKNDDLGEK